MIVAYLTADFTHTGGNSSGTDGAYTWVSFTSSGTLVLTDAGGGGEAATTPIMRITGDVIFSGDVIIRRQ